MPKLFAMNQYQKAMFNAYYPTIAVFIGFPLFVIGIMDFPFGLLRSLFFGIIIVSPLFISGYILAPILGPKCKSGKSNGALMAAISLAFFSFFISIFWVFSMTGSADLFFSVILSFIIFIAGVGPAMFSALLFIGQCEKL